MTASRQHIIPVILLALAPVLVPDVPRAASVVNIQKKLHKTERGGLYGALSGTVNWKKGNTNLLSIEADLGTFYSRHPHLVYVSLAFAYAQEGEDGDPLIYRSFEHLRYRFAILDWLELEAFGQHDFDRFRRLQIRGLGGAGFHLGFEISEDCFFLDLGTSYMFEYVEADRDPDLGDSGKQETNHRWNNYLTLAFTPIEEIGLDTTVYVQPRFDEFGDVLLLSETNATFRVTGWLTTRISYVFAWDADPFETVHAWDSSLSFSVGLTFGPWFGPKPEGEEGRKTDPHTEVEPGEDAPSPPTPPPLPPAEDDAAEDHADVPPVDEEPA